MSLVEINAVERFAHALGAPLAAGAEAVLDDIEAGTMRMNEAVDAVMERFAARPRDIEATRASHLKIVDALVAMISSAITAYAERCEGIADTVIRTAMYDAHDAMVAEYYRLLALRADLDPEANAGGAVVKSSKDLKAWFNEALS